jgi:hypothetical protein
MAFDPSIISQIPDMAGNPVAAKAEGYKLADMATGAESNKLLLGQQKQQIADKEKAKNLLKGTKLDSPQDVTKAAEKLTQAGLPDEAMQFMKAMQGLQESKGNLTLQQYKVLEEKNNLMGSAAATLVNQYQGMVDSGVSPQLAQAIMQPKYTAALQQLGQTKLGDGTPALNQQDLGQIGQNPKFDPNFLRTIADRSKQSAAALTEQMKFHQEQVRDKTEAIKARAEDRMSKNEERLERATEEQARENRAKDEARKEGIPEKLSVDALEVAGPVVMADPSQMSRYAGRSPKDPRMGQINEWIGHHLKEAGLGWQDMERLRQNFKSESKSIDKMTAQLNGIESFEGLARANGERVLDLIKMVDDTSVPLAEGFLRSAKRKTGGVDAGELASVLNSFQTETARIIGGNPNMTGVVTDSARKDVQAIAPQSMSAAQAERNIKRLFTEMDLRKDLIRQQIGQAQKRSTDIGPDAALAARNPDGSLAAPTAAPAPPGATPAAGAQPPAVASPAGAAPPAAPPPAAPGGGFSHLWNNPTS